MRIIIPVIGLFIGSFANVLIYRIPKKEEWIRTPSHCPACGKRLHWYELIPVLSWLALKGRCRNCNSRISVQYPLVELTNGLLWIICVWVFGISPFLPVSLALSTSLLVLTVIDWKISEIPDGINLFLLIAGLAWNAYALFSGYDIWRQNLIGFAAVSVPLLLIAMITNGGMGGGDIKLMAVCGLVLGWQNILLSLALASVIGALFMLPSLITKKRDGKSQVPFGPFLATGVFISLCFGSDLISLYLRLFI